MLIQLGDKFYYSSFQDANEGGLDFKVTILSAEAAIPIFSFCAARRSLQCPSFLLHES